MARKRRKSTKGKTTAYSRCVGKKLRGTRPGSRRKAIANLRAAARACKGK